MVTLKWNLVDLVILITKLMTQMDLYENTDDEMYIEFSGSSDANSNKNTTVDNADGEIELEFSGSSDANSNADGKIDLEFSGSSDTNSNKHINADGSEILSNMNEYE